MNNLLWEKDFEYVFAEWLDFKFSEIVKREMDVPLEHDLIISVVGPRQAGKTFLMYQIIQELWRKIPKDNVVYIKQDSFRSVELDKRLPAVDLGTDLIQLRAR